MSQSGIVIFHRGSLFIFWIYLTMSTVFVTYEIHTRTVKGTLFSTPSSGFVIGRLSSNSYSDRCEVVCQSSLHFHFSPNEWWWYFFVLMALCIFALGKCLFRTLAHFSIGLLVLICRWVVSFAQLEIVKPQPDLTLRSRSNASGLCKDVGQMGIFWWTAALIPVLLLSRGLLKLLPFFPWEPLFLSLYTCSDDRIHSQIQEH